MKENRITKTRLLREVNNDMVHNFYYQYSCRVYKDDAHYFKFSFILWFDAEEVCEFWDSDFVSKKEIKSYAYEIGYNFLDNAPNGKNVNDDTIKWFFDHCNETIKNYIG